MHEYIEMLSILVVFMLFTILVWKKNYWLHGFWILVILWFGIVAIDASTIVEYPVILMLFTTILNMFSISKRGVLGD